MVLLHSVVAQVDKGVVKGSGIEALGRQPQVAAAELPDHERVHRRDQHPQTDVELPAWYRRSDSHVRNSDDLNTHYKGAL